VARPEARFRLDFKGSASCCWTGSFPASRGCCGWSARLADVAGLGEDCGPAVSGHQGQHAQLRSEESGEADKGLQEKHPYWKVRIDEHSLISKIGAWLKGASGMGVTLFHTVNFNRKIKPPRREASTCGGWRTS
jgi:hypothetical protein